MEKTKIEKVLKKVSGLTTLQTWRPAQIQFLRKRMDLTGVTIQEQVRNLVAEEMRKEAKNV